MNSYLTVRKFLGHPNTFKLLNGWHPLKEKKNMMLSTAEWRKNNPPPPKQVPRPAAIPTRKSSHKLKTRAKGRHQPQSLTDRATGFHGKCISDGHNHDGISEGGGSQIKIPEMIPDIFDSIQELYEAINDMKNHLFDKNETICNNIKTNNLSLCQVNETLMCFEKVLRTIKTSNNDNFLGNKINEKSAIIKELTDKYFKFNIDDIIEARIKQAIDIIKTDNKKFLDDI
ncbi:hypothetical protein O181_121180 [Austropuccinia psidii MF-1]|uniref:Uncharacterized protein n=1 Tax=Austropuccinia psidii MF-1 TaxID=1389203 RepID=A0A9Q3Q225_9BASI|nr:hypothetical protein [Austropuccinia psidii MF-1]